MEKVLIIIGDATETVDTLYPYYRLIEAGFRPVVAAPEKRRYQMVMHEVKPGWTITKEWEGYLLGHNEFFLACRTETDAIHQLLEITTRFVIDWLAYQQEVFPSIDGILLLEDLMGFVGEQDFEQLVLPRMQRIFASLGVSVRFLHNDAFGLITARHLTAMGVNLFNFSFEHDAGEIRRLAGDAVTLMGNIPPRDVLGQGSPDDVRRSVAGMLSSITDRRRWIISAGGFTPGGFGAEKIEAFCQAVAAE